MGITARGAWESVKHHLLLSGINLESENVRVVGIGDMSGDVLAMECCYPEYAVVAAFDHRHIFIDPTPTGKAYAERKRLFELERSSWEDLIEK